MNNDRTVEMEILNESNINFDVVTDEIDMDIDSSGEPITNYEALTNKPKINGVTLVGNREIIEDKNFVFVQTTATNTWVIEHDLNKYPSVEVVDSAGSSVVGMVKYDTLNQVTVTFKSGFKGKAILN